MKKLILAIRTLTLLLLTLAMLPSISSFSQCTNAGFENCNFGGWVGTNCKSDSTVAPSTCLAGTGPPSFIPCTVIPGVVTISAPDPFKYKNLSIGAVNQAPNATPENSQFIMNSGSDAFVGGGSLPVVCPGSGTCSGRLGNQQANGGGESMMYKYLVNNTNALFTYNYAVVLNDGNHGKGQQPYFRIRMWAYGINTPTDSVPINCATYDVDASTAKTIGGFTTIQTDVLWKNWSAVTIPLQSYIGKQVSIQFITRDCCPSCDTAGNGGSGGGHFAYGYIDASCGPQAIIPSQAAVCAGQNDTLSAPAGAASYAWTGSQPFVSGTSSRTAIVNQPGTYTVTMTTIGNTPCTYVLTTTMPQNLPGAGAVSVTSATICNGGSATLTASGGVTYTWSTNEITPFITVSPTTTTTYSVTGTSATCGSGTATGTVTVNPIPTSPFTVTPVCVGVGSTITYTGNASPSDTYNWNFGGGTVISGTGQGPYSVSWPSSGSKNVTLTVTAGNCVSPLTTNAVTVNPPPVVIVTNTTVCTGTPGTITAAGASTYIWSDVPATSGPSLSATLTTTTTYSVTGTDANGCTGTAVGTINVNQLQNATFSYNPATVCKTGGSNPSPMLSGTTPGGTFSCTADANLSINATTGVIDLANTPLNNYTVTYTTPGPCPNSSTFDISVVNVPIADFTLGVYCQNDVNPIPTYINGGTPGTFTESTGNLKFVNPITTPGEVNLAASIPGTYNVTNSVGGGGSCPVVTATYSIVINPIPVTTVNNQTICLGASATLTAGGATTYVWAADGSVLTTFTASPGTTTPYTVTGTSAGCSSTAFGTITVNPIPVTTVDNQTVCAGVSATLTAAGANSYVWSDNTTLTTLTATPGTTTPYTVTGSSLGCSSSATGSITVNPIPVITVNNPNICVGNSVSLLAGGATTYSWSPGGSAANPLVVSPPSSTSYTVTGTSLGCIGTAVSNVTITLLPVLKLNSSTICIGASTTLNASGGATYDWSTGASGVNSITVTPPVGITTYTVADNTPNCSGFATASVTVNPLPVVTATGGAMCVGKNATLTAAGAAIYVWSNGAVTNPTTVTPANNASYTVTGTSAAGCIDTAVANVIVNPLPIITVTNDTICEGLNATLTAAGALSYVWSNNAVTNPLVVSPTKSGNNLYTVTGTDVNGCSASNIGSVTVYPKPGADFSVAPIPAIVTYPTITFTDQSSPDVTYWHWDFGNGDSLAPSTPSPVYTYPAEEKTYTVTLVVHNAGFCYNSVTHQVVIGPEYSFFIPNAFTPDGDGINDTFFGKGKGIIEYELMIFDRWGNFIFYADDLNKGWDGKANGGAEVAQQDVYVWKVNLMDIFNKKHSFIGTVTILRGK
jgi:gliding motility-associated-like protein